MARGGRHDHGEGKLEGLTAFLGGEWIGILESATWKETELDRRKAITDFYRLRDRLMGIIPEEAREYMLSLVPHPIFQRLAEVPENKKPESKAKTTFLCYTCMEETEHHILLGYRECRVCGRRKDNE